MSKQADMAIDILRATNDGDDLDPADLKFLSLPAHPSSLSLELEERASYFINFSSTIVSCPGHEMFGQGAYPSAIHFLACSTLSTSS
ncbi:hypothetical protein ES703_37024 [subsurface metagenome]